MLSMAGITATAAGGAGQIASSTAPQPRLVHAAHEFEAQMMKELLKPMTGTNGLDGEDSDSSSGSNGALGEFASEALGRALSEQGGFGIASSIVRELSPRGNSPAISGVMEGLHGNTVINSLK
jgi:Rod binding domain-containing protein